MKIVVAMDSFKSSISALSACKIIRDTLLSINPELTIASIPMADGGEGTAEALMAARRGKWINVQTMGPLPEMKVKAGFALFLDTKVALVEMAKASGLELLSPKQFDPINTTTFGTGQLIQAATNYGAVKILLAVGGSATVDGGVGAAQALGWKFLNSKGKPIGFGGGQLERIAKIIKPGKINLPEIKVLCDVDNPLVGKDGAARVFAPQKGATPEMVEQLEAGLNHLAKIVKKKLGTEIDKIPGSGAAGGLSAGAFAFMGAKLVSGVETVIRESGLEKEISDADWVITGEGRFDSQSLRGKVVSGVTKAAKLSHKKVCIIAGRVELPKSKWRDFGITDAITLSDKTMNLTYAIAHTKNLLADAAKKFAQANLKN
ncbi:MAG: glycerate kinase [Phycisphaerae bacterium]|nr:glycerate kinase [Phycisphaerae bacterium]